MAREPFQVTKQHGLMARVLPNNADVEFMRASIRVDPRCGIIGELV